MPKIANYYIEYGDKDKLEKMLYANGFAFYDATNYDPYTKSGSNFLTIESIEADLECK